MTVKQINKVGLSALAFLIFTLVLKMSGLDGWLFGATNVLGLISYIASVIPEKEKHD